jgi:hypothetical protein
MHAESEPAIFRHAGAMGLEGIVSDRPSLDPASRIPDPIAPGEGAASSPDLARLLLFRHVRDESVNPSVDPFGAQPAAGAAYVSTGFQSG